MILTKILKYNQNEKFGIVFLKIKCQKETKSMGIFSCEKITTQIFDL